jgi:hypothetical protein
MRRFGQTKRSVMLAGAGLAEKLDANGFALLDNEMIRVVQSFPYVAFSIETD